MFRIEGTTIHLSRGDKAKFTVSLLDGENNYTFQPGDIVRFTITENFKSTSYLLQKEFLVEEATELVEISLTCEDTMIGTGNAKPVTYQYDIVLNDEYSVIAYDPSGSKEFILYPRSIDKTPGTCN